MDFEKFYLWMSIIVGIILGIIAFISGINFLEASTETEEHRWLFILITCFVIILSMGVLASILDIKKRPDKYKKPDYVNKKKAKIAGNLLIAGGLLVLISGITLIYILALIPKNSLDTYIYLISAIIWIGFILVIISIIYGAVTDAYKTQKQKT